MYLITGCAGFIGYHTALEFLSKKEKVYGIDNLNSYYDVNLKKDRLRKLKRFDSFHFNKVDISDYKKLEKVIKKFNPKIIINLAAQAGVRHSIKNPDDYFNSNVVGFYNLLKICKKFKIKHLIYASTSSVYGNNKSLPSKEDQLTNPIQFYASTKISNETMASAFSKIYNFTTTGLRFFTVYGEWGRPDMAIFKFVKNIKSNKKIDLYNNGEHQRDFSYVKNISDCIYRLAKNKIYLKNNVAKNNVYNLGNGRKIHLKKVIKIIEKILDKKAKIKKLPLQQGDIKSTYASIRLAKKDLSLKHNHSVETGIKNFIDWYNEYYN
jgi:UDP-glucuronate 4-epimerase